MGEYGNGVAFPHGDDWAPDVAVVVVGVVAEAAATPVGASGAALRWPEANAQVARGCACCAAEVVVEVVAA